MSSISSSIILLLIVILSSTSVAQSRSPAAFVHINGRVFRQSSTYQNGKTTTMMTIRAAGPAIMEPPPTIEKESTVEKKKSSENKEESYSGKRGGWAVRLFNDPFNKREFVAMCLTQIVGLTDGQSYQVMMQAHQNGVAIVGRFDLERAELYKTSLNEHGLLSDMIPVEDD
jgi:ATP-dependent Clp protease adaptor protein ClpS